jgi:choline-glycine betaine transporter
MTHQGERLEFDRPIPQKFLRGINPVVTLGATGLTISFMVIVITVPKTSLIWLIDTREPLSPVLASYYVALVGFFLVFEVCSGMGRYSNVRLGPDKAPSEFATLSWVLMLLAAGSGLGLLFWSIAEPVTHFDGNSFSDEPGTPAAAVKGLNLSFFHWRLKGLAIFCITGLLLLALICRRDLLSTLRSARYSLIGDPEPPRVQRVLWRLGGCALTSVLLVVGGVQALQDAVITAGLPFVDRPRRRDIVSRHPIPGLTIVGGAYWRLLTDGNEMIANDRAWRARLTQLELVDLGRLWSRVIAIHQGLRTFIDHQSNNTERSAT